MINTAEDVSRFMIDILVFGILCNINFIFEIVVVKK